MNIATGRDLTTFLKVVKSNTTQTIHDSVCLMAIH